MVDTPWSLFIDKLTNAVAGDRIALLDSEDGLDPNKTMLLDLFAQSTAILSSPENTRHVKSQTELEAFLGPDLIIPASTNITVIIDESFSITKPFKKQADSSLLLYSQSSSVKLSYFGPGEGIQMDGAVIGRRTQISNLEFAGNFTNSAFAIEDSEFFTIDLSFVTQFAKIGFLKGMSVIWDKSAPIANFTGLDFINNPFVILNAAPNSELVPFQLTMFNFISDIETDVVILNSRFISDTADEFVFIDPNSPEGSSFTVKDSGSITTLPESLFQKGVDTAVAEVLDDGNGKLKCISEAHGQVDGTYAVLSGFSEPTYNRTAKITVLSIDLFSVEEITFVPGADSGNVNRQSLDSTDVRVLSEDNPDQSDSMFIGSAGLEVFGAPIVSASLAQNEFEVITSPNWLFNQLERFSEGISNEGQLICNDTSKRKYRIRYEGTIEKSGGSGGNIGIILVKNGNIEIAFNPPHTEDSGQIFLGSDDLVELTKTNGLQVAVKNYAAAAAIINTSQISLVISKG